MASPLNHTAAVEQRVEREYKDRGDRHCGNRQRCVTLNESAWRHISRLSGSCSGVQLLCLSVEEYHVVVDTPRETAKSSSVVEGRHGFLFHGCVDGRFIYMFHLMVLFVSS